MKLHDLRPAEGSHRARTRVGRGIAAGKGKTAGRGTKGQKARAGGSIPPWFEGGQTPLHMRIPKLRGFKNRFKVEYEVVNVGSIAKAVEDGAFEPGDLPGAKTGKSAKPAPVTINQDVLRAAGLVRTLSKPLKVLGSGDLSVALFVVADGFSKSAVTKIEAAGGTVQVLERPSTPLAALGVDLPADRPTAPSERSAPSEETTPEPAPEPELAAEIDTEPAAEAVAEPAAKPARTRAPKAKANASDASAATEPAADAVTAGETEAETASQDASTSEAGTETETDETGG
jgi:large subunit ribosomal protein L15